MTYWFMENAKYIRTFLESFKVNFKIFWEIKETKITYVWGRQTLFVRRLTVYKNWKVKKKDLDLTSGYISTVSRNQLDSTMDLPVELAGLLKHAGIDGKKLP